MLINMNNHCLKMIVNDKNSTFASIMNATFSHIIHKFISILLALNFLNNCVDSVDPITQGMKEDLSYNDIESVAELIAEIIFVFDNASIELEDNDPGNDGANLKEEIEYHVQHKYHPTKPQSIIVIDQCITKIPDAHSHQYHPEVTPPPPKA